jgi:hypothetical protein
MKIVSVTVVSLDNTIRINVLGFSYYISAMIINETYEKLQYKKD